MTSFKITVDDQAVRQALADLAAKAGDLSPALRAIARLLRNSTEDAFAKQASPFGAAWAQLKPATLKARRGGGAGARILQDSGQLAASITATSDATSATLTAGKRYAAIHQFGGQIDYAPRSIKVRLRTDRRGNLLKRGNLVVFARGTHKNAVTRWGTSQGWSLQIPARPFLPIDRAGALPPAVTAGILDILRRRLAGR